ncbi:MULTISPECIES: hypothetical protein [unclassified Rathayibacter]|uniref:hypothetical protein n=1 Tax=unclassified Rathayibacter TaxID=2609250 RepID=UPI00188BADBC|nr:MULTISPECIES: hypothetical protein [unclassified Rathayibacter]MBF4462767.1 hypothetical protein [Rathayibacter sp. VKM Ac-2879]MBF4504181.1 hypothetical protein [Rathayibacter sp. VKM Ac-2878]
MTSPQPSLVERVRRTRAALSALAGTTSEREVRPLREAVELAAEGRSDCAALLDEVDEQSALLTLAETQLSGLERSVREDLDRAISLSELRTAAQLASAAEVATACAVARSLLLDADEARAAGARHDPATVLLLLLDADAALDDVVSTYREPAVQAERRLLLLEAARTATRLAVGAVTVLAAVHGDGVTEAPLILAREAREQLDAAFRRAASDPAAAVSATRAAADRARSALDEALVDLDGRVTPARSELPGSLPAA